MDWDAVVSEKVLQRQDEILVLLSVLTNWFKHDFSDGMPACDGWATCQD